MTDDRTQPEALRIADVLTCGRSPYLTDISDAAIELRRLHAENERLRSAAQAGLDALVWEAGSEPALYSGQTLHAVLALRAALGRNE